MAPTIGIALPRTFAAVPPAVTNPWAIVKPLSTAESANAVPCKPTSARMVARCSALTSLPLSSLPVANIFAIGAKVAVLLATNASDAIPPNALEAVPA